MNKKRVERLMRENNIRRKKVKKFKKTTDSSHDFPVSEDPLKRRFGVTQPGLGWVSQITFLNASDGWLYLCVWIDLFSRMAVVWSTSSSLTSRFVCDVLQSALNRRPGALPLIHPYREVQYDSKKFSRLLCRNKLRQSMSRKGNCWDNGVAESFFATIECEIAPTTLKLSKTFREAVFSHREIFYNRKD